MKNETKLIITLILIIGLVITILATVSIQRDNMEQRALRAEAKIIVLKQTIKWIAILEQILPELAKDELNALDEQFRQRKQDGG